MFFKRKHYIGISIGQEYLNLVHIKKEFRGVKINNIESFPVLPSDFADGQLLDRSKLQETLRCYVREHRLSKVSTVIGITPRLVVFRTLRMPEMSPKDLDKALLWEAKSIVTLATNDITTDHIKIGTTKVDNVLQHDILLMAAKTNILKELGLLVKEAGLKLRAVDLESIAYLYLRTFAMRSGICPELEEAWALAEIEDNRLTVSFFRKDTLQFLRSVNLVYNDVPQDSENKMDIPEMIKELQQTLDYYHQNLKRPATDILYITGDMAEKTLPLLQENLTLPVSVLDVVSLSAPFTIKGKENMESNPLALGLALRGVI